MSTTVDKGEARADQRERATVRSAREVAHIGLSGGTTILCGGAIDGPPGSHTFRCDRLTAAIEARDAEHAIERDALKEQLRVAVEALEGIDFGRVNDDGYCNACEECDSENPCVHRFAHDAIEAISRLAAPPDGGAGA